MWLNMVAATFPGTREEAANVKKQPLGGRERQKQKEKRKIERNCYIYILSRNVDPQAGCSSGAVTIKRQFTRSLFKSRVDNR